MNILKYPYLNDSKFLKEVDNMENKEQVVKITILDMKEKALQSIEGRITGGSLNINASSAIRRTGSLSLIADEDKNDLTNLNSLFYLNKKVKLEIGFKNTLDKYLEHGILWFPLGVYLMSNPSLSSGTGGVSISLNLKDKMCQLNGEFGGTIPTAISFHEDADGNPVDFYKIIRELVNHWGGEQLGKIIIENVPDKIESILKWEGEKQLIFSEDNLLYMYEQGDIIGKRLEEAHPTQEIISNPGDTVVTILDKIKSELGNYEYFYDLDGNFVFREIRNYLNTSYASSLDKKIIDLDLDNFIIDQTKGKSIYNFDDATLITSFSNSPKADDIKNDFVVWGKKHGTDVAIKYRITIDKKPKLNFHTDLVFYKENDIVKASKYTNEDVKNTALLYSKDLRWYKFNGEEYEDITLDVVDFGGRMSADWRTELYYQGIESLAAGVATNAYFDELREEWPKIYDLVKNEFYEESLKNPYELNYFLDFIDTSSHIADMGVNIIGRKTKAENNDKINCVFTYDIPDRYWTKDGEETADVERRGYKAHEMENEIMLDFMHNSGTPNDAYTRARELLYTHTQWSNAISIAAIPIYYLEPNHRITVNDNVSGIHGDYLINSISLPLDVSGTMTLSCSKVLEKL